MKKLRKYLEAVFIGVLLIYGCAALVSSAGITGMQQPGEILTPKVYVIILGCLLILLCVANLAVSIGKARKTKDGPESEELSRTGLMKTIIMVALGFLFVIGMRVIGFYVTAFLVAAVGYVTIEGTARKELLTSIVFALVMCGLFWFVFRQFHIYLPKYLLDGIL